MGFFSKLIDEINDFASTIGDDLSLLSHEVTANKTRPSVTSLTYTPLDPAVADDIEKRKPANYTSPDIGQFLESIRSGLVEYTEVLGVATYDKTMGEGSTAFQDDPYIRRYNYYTYFKVADLSGVVYKEAVMAWINKTHLPSEESGKAEEAAPENADAPKPQYQRNPDPVNPEKYTHVYLLHYTIKKKEYYRVLTKEQFEDMVPGVIYVKIKYDSFYTGGGHEWQEERCDE